MSRYTALYSAVDDEITHYELNIDTAKLSAKSTIRLPAKVQYAWPHPSRGHLYVSTSNGGPRVPSSHNHVTALSISSNGHLAVEGDVGILSHRAVHMCVDPSGRFALNGHNFPVSGITVHRIETDGGVGAEIPQDSKLNYGIYPHQVMTFPSGRTALIVDRGNKAQGDTPEQPGALRSFGFEDGVLSSGQVVAPNGGFGFGPRHVDFHPEKPWLYVSDERFNRLYMFRLDGDRIEPEPAYTCDTLAESSNVRPRQMAGAIHVHPSGKFVYLANRSDHTIEHGLGKVYGGGENSIAVFAINSETGEPTLVQHADTNSFHVRTFACDPEGRLLVTASIKPLSFLRDGHVEQVPAALSIFRIETNGQLTFLRMYDVETQGSEMQYWMGIVGID